MTLVRRGALRGLPPPARLTDVAPDGVDGLLAPAGPGLRFLDEHLPRRARLAGVAGLPPPPTDAAAVRRRVDRLRGIDLRALAARADDLRHAADTVARRHHAVADEAGVLWESWSGPAADDVADRVVVVARAAHAVVETLASVAEGIERAGLAVADAVVALATALRDLPGPDGGAVPAGGEGPDPTGPDPTTFDPARTRAYAAALDARIHRLLAVADRTDEAVDAARAALAERLAQLPTTPAPGHGGFGLDPAQVEALLAETVGPLVGVPGPLRGDDGPADDRASGEPAAALDALGPRAGLRPPPG